jgi:hypothetical protein
VLAACCCSWQDAWAALQPGAPGITYDAKNNPMLPYKGTPSLRLDRYVVVVPAYIHQPHCFVCMSSLLCNAMQGELAKLLLLLWSCVACRIMCKLRDWRLSSIETVGTQGIRCCGLSIAALPAMVPCCCLQDLVQAARLAVEQH